MTVLAQKDLFSNRYRKVPALNPLEYKMQIALAELLRLLGRKGVDWWHTPNGELRNKRHAAKLKAMGVRPGVADFFFTWGEPVSVAAEPQVRIFPQNLFLELKRRGEHLSPDQEQFRDSVTVKGSFYEVADNIDDAIAILKRYHILRSTTQGISA
jgi:hypothetical protein